MNTMPTFNAGQFLTLDSTDLFHLVLRRYWEKNTKNLTAKLNPFFPFLHATLSQYLVQLLQPAGSSYFSDCTT